MLYASSQISALVMCTAVRDDLPDWSMRAGISTACVCGSTGIVAEEVVEKMPPVLVSLCKRLVRYSPHFMA